MSETRSEKSKPVAAVRARLIGGLQETGYALQGLLRASQDLGSVSLSLLQEGWAERGKGAPREAPAETQVTDPPTAAEEAGEAEETVPTGISSAVQLASRAMDKATNYLDCLLMREEFRPRQGKWLYFEIAADEEIVEQLPAVDLDKVLHVMMTEITATYGLRYNRAALFLLEPDQWCLTGRMAIGHVNQQEAFKDWELDRLQKRDNFERYLELLDDNILPRTPLEVRMRHLRLPLGEADTDLFSRVMLEGGCLLVEPEAFGRLPRLFLSVFVPTTPLIIIPIKPGGRVIGLLVVDNKFTEAPITETEIKILNTYVATELVAISEGTLHHYVRTADVAALSQEKVLLVDSDEGPKQIRHSDLIRIVGIGEEYERRLFAAGIFSQAELLEAAATRRDRQDTAEKAGISHSLILTWSNHIDLCRIPGIDEEMAYLLELVGVDTVPELAQRNANNLHQSLTEVILSQAKKRKLNVEEVARWIELAGGLTRVLQY